MFYNKMPQFYYKMQQLLEIETILLQNATFITNCDSTVVQENLGTHLKSTLTQVWKMHYTDAHIKIESCKLCIFNPYSFRVIYP